MDPDRFQMKDLKRRVAQLERDVKKLLVRTASMRRDQEVMSKFLKRQFDPGLEETK